MWRRNGWGRRRYEQAVGKVDFSGLVSDLFCSLLLNCGLLFAAQVLELPLNGVPVPDLDRMLQVLATFGKPKERMLEGRVSGTIYVGGEDFEQYSEFLTKVYGLFAWTNPLHPNVFPGVRQMEAEVIAMTLKLFHAGPDACGLVSSGECRILCASLLSSLFLFPFFFYVCICVFCFVSFMLLSMLPCTWSRWNRVYFTGDFGPPECCL